MRHQKKPRKTRERGFLEKVNLYAAGIDIGAKSLFVAVPEELDEQPVREFACFTGDLNRLAESRTPYRSARPPRGARERQNPSSAYGRIAGMDWSA